MSFSVICPTYNEEKFITDVIHFCIHSNPKPKEIFFIDGGSKDQTTEIIQNFILQDSSIELLHNPDKIVPFALNLAIPRCTGDIIIRLDAHTHYAPDYFKSILEVFNTVDTDIAGGPTRTAYHNSIQESVAYAFNCVFGMGNSSVHDPEFRGYTDSVTFGAWKKSIFSKTGLFDTQLKNNQDDEFHYRAKSMGFKIFQDPTIKLFYYPRNTYKSLFRQYYNYGYFKPLVLKKIKTEVKLRHLVPSFFVLNFVMLLFSSHLIFLIPAILYLMLDLYFSFINKKPIKIKLLNLLTFPVIHAGYGLGFIIGLIFNLKNKKLNVG